MLPEGGTHEMADIIVEEQEKSYPECKFYGVLTVHAIFPRQEKRFLLKNVKMKTVDMHIMTDFMFHVIQTLAIDIKK